MVLSCLLSLSLGCGSKQPEGGTPTSAPPPLPGPTSTLTPTGTPPPSTTVAPTPSLSSALPGGSTWLPPEDGWTLTVYYTAVERFHQGQPERVTGCPRQDCEHGGDDLGSYPQDFVQAVRDEGTGRITSGMHRDRYLNWSYDTGFWLDTVPAGTTGARLEPFSTAAADATALPRGSVFTIVDCGVEEDGARIDLAACDRLRGSTWTVRDEFTPGLGGDRHIDLYIGEEDREGFTDGSPLYLTGIGARIARAG